jgi:hypothetical protein
MTGPLIEGCQAGVSEPVKSIVVDRQVLLRDLTMHPNAIVRTPEGGFLIAGFSGTAWAVATNAQGEELWKYIDPPDDSVHERSQSFSRSVFYGAVPLGNGNALFCGSKDTKDGQTVNDITILDNNGHAVERRTEIPNGDRTLKSSSFGECFHTEDGVTLMGSANNGTQGYLWIVRLDKSGGKKSEILVNAMGAVKDIEAAEPSWVIDTAGSAFDELNLIRVNQKGEIIARRPIKGRFLIRLRPSVSTRKTRVIGYADGGQATLYILDEELHDSENPKLVGNFDVTQGVGYVLKDNSLALFGRKDNAAVAWISASGRSSTIREFDLKYKSFVIEDAVPISANQFVSVRDSVSTNPSDRGVVMSWITIK